MHKLHSRTYIAKFWGLALEKQFQSLWRLYLKSDFTDFCLKFEILSNEIAFEG